MFRIDHFLGRSAVLNLLGLRLTNGIFEPLWNRERMAAVNVVFDEELGLEGMAGYYDLAGAMVNMVQSHLPQPRMVITITFRDAPTCPTAFVE